MSSYFNEIRNILCGPHEHVANFETVCRGKHVAMPQKWDTREPKRLVIFNRQSHVWANLNHMPGIKLYFSLWFKMLPILQNTVLEFIGFNTLWDVPLRVFAEFVGPCSHHAGCARYWVQKRQGCTVTWLSHWDPESQNWDQHFLETSWNDQHFKVCYVQTTEDCSLKFPRM